MDKKAAIVISLKEMVDKEYAMGRTTIMSDGELEAMIKQLALNFLKSDDITHII